MTRKSQFQWYTAREKNWKETRIGRREKVMLEKATHEMKQSRLLMEDSGVWLQALIFLSASLKMMTLLKTTVLYHQHSHIHKRPGCLILVLYVFTTSYRIQGTSRASCVAARAEERKESKYEIDRCQKSQRFLIFWLRISIKLFTEACSSTPS